MRPRIRGLLRDCSWTAPAVLLDLGSPGNSARTLEATGLGAASGPLRMVHCHVVAPISLILLVFHIPPLDEERATYLNIEQPPNDC
ncbi:uncharacterized protein N7482_000141 [Penicillium canariense]|uniref:Uncharacterized protein n=1 Tax=Penicillium canariense TaxID=189055 RepID=A0A9W9IB06_9EURO|nr:uncharacterized protein N7482_000141 [Penicillium canariense]KAJ5174264.1 hypothetical protein N7482_000141 [Penicillium canariense]